MECAVRWDSTHSQCFRVLRGTKQGSISSPTIFNTYINDLFIELLTGDIGNRIDGKLLSSFSYADDIKLMSSQDS